MLKKARCTLFFFFFFPQRFLQDIHIMDFFTKSKELPFPMVVLQCVKLHLLLGSMTRSITYQKQRPDRGKGGEKLLMFLQETVCSILISLCWIKKKLVRGYLEVNELPTWMNIKLHNSYIKAQHLCASCHLLSNQFPNVMTKSQASRLTG